MTKLSLFRNRPKTKGSNMTCAELEAAIAAAIDPAEKAALEAQWRAQNCNRDPGSGGGPGGGTKPPL